MNPLFLDPFFLNCLGNGVAVDLDGVEALRLVGNAGLGAVEANCGGGISGSLGIGDLAGDHDAALDGLGQDSLAGLWVLIPAEGLARQEGVAEPLEGDEGVTAPFGLSECGAKLLDSRVEVGGDDGLLAVVVVLVVESFAVMMRIMVACVGGAVVRECARRTLLARNCFAVVDRLKVDSNLIFLRRPGAGGSVPALTAAVFSAKLDDGLIPRRSQKTEGSGKAGVGRKGQLVQSVLNNLFGFRDAQVAEVDAAVLSFCRFHLSHSVFARSGRPRPHPRLN